MRPIESALVRSTGRRVAVGRVHRRRAGPFPTSDSSIVAQHLSRETRARGTNAARDRRDTDFLKPEVLVGIASYLPADLRR